MNAETRNADDARRKEIANAGRRLERFLESLSPPDLGRQSACEGWTVADVVAHIIERGRPIPDQIERGLAGDLSPTPGVSDAPPENEDVFRQQLDHSAVALRRELGDDLLPEFARLNREFDRVLSLLGPEDWDKLCYHRLRPETARAKADIRIAELAMHEWDLRWAFDIRPMRCPLGGRIGRKGCGGHSGPTRGEPARCATASPCRARRPRWWTSSFRLKARHSG